MSGDNDLLWQTWIASHLPEELQSSKVTLHNENKTRQEIKA